MAVGFPVKDDYVTGDVLTAANMNDLSGTVNLLDSAQYAAGKNKIINGDFGINQRAFSSTAVNGAYGFDRWYTQQADGTTSYSLQTFTPGTAPVAGYEAINFARVSSSGQTLTSASLNLRQGIEDVRTLAGQTATISFYAKANSGSPKVAVELIQSFGSGGSPSTAVLTYVNQVTLSTSWARYSVTVSVPSISGKTIGTTANTSQLIIVLWCSAGSDFNARTGSLGIQSNTFDFWGVQLEEGSTASAFQTATGTIQGELAACQRYYWRNTPGNTYGTYNCFGLYVATDQWQGIINHPVPMRIAPTTLEYGNLATFDGVTITAAATIAITANQTTTLGTYLANTGISGRTQFRPAFLISNNNTAGYIGLSAEL